MITPKYLKNGDKVGIVSPAGKIEKGKIDSAVEIIKAWGLVPVLGKHVVDSHYRYAGTDEQRLEDLQSMLDNAEIKAILCARGGYGTIRIIDKLDFTSFAKNPKWIAGCSDITILHSHIHSNYNIETIHSVMPVSYSKDKTSVESLFNALLGKANSYKIDNNNLNRAGECSGILIGGNLSIIYSLIGTNSDINTDGKILFIEEVSEYLYNIDRMMHSLKKAGKLKGLSGLIVGGLSDLKDNEDPFGKIVEEIIREAVDEYSYPVCFGFPAGHIDNNNALILGRKVRLEVAAKVNVGYCE